MEEQEEAGGFSLVSYEDEEEEEELPPQHTASSAAPTSTDGDGVDNPTDMGEAASHEAETGPSEMNLEATPSTDQLSTQNVPQQDHWTGIGSMHPTPQSRFFFPAFSIGLIGGTKD